MEVAKLAEEQLNCGVAERTQRCCPALTDSALSREQPPSSRAWLDACLGTAGQLDLQIRPRPVTEGLLLQGLETRLRGRALAEPSTRLCVSASRLAGAHSSSTAGDGNPRNGVVPARGSPDTRKRTRCAEVGAHQLLPQHLKEGAQPPLAPVTFEPTCRVLGAAASLQSDRLPSSIAYCGTQCMRDAPRCRNGTILGLEVQIRGWAESVPA